MTTQPTPEAAQPRFAGHRLVQLTCNHEQRNDTVLCECGWQKDFDSVGACFDNWLEHATTAQPCGERLNDFTTCTEPVGHLGDHIERRKGSTTTWHRVAHPPSEGKLRELIAQWREMEQWRRENFDVDRMGTVVSDRLKLCADELEAALEGK